MAEDVRRDGNGDLPPGFFDEYPRGDYIARMDQRIQHLEHDMGEVKSTLAAMRDDISEIKGHIAHLPTALDFAQLRSAIDSLSSKAYVWQTAATVTVGIVALVLAAIALAPYLRPTVG